MLARLGNVIYWMTCGLAILVLSMFVSLAMKDGWGLVLYGIMAATMIWVVGRAVRSVLAGR